MYTFHVHGLPFDNTIVPIDSIFTNLAKSVRVYAGLSTNRFAEVEMYTEPEKSDPYRRSAYHGCSIRVPSNWTHAVRDGNPFSASTCVPHDHRIISRDDEHRRNVHPCPLRNTRNSPCTVRGVYSLVKRAFYSIVM